MDNDEDCKEAPASLSAKEVFFTKNSRLSSSVSKDQDPKKLIVLVSKGTQTEIFLGETTLKSFP